MTSTAQSTTGSQPVAITIDGATATGKTTLAMGLRARLHRPVLDTGLTYRAAAHITVTCPELPPEQILAGLHHEPAAGHPQVLTFAGQDLTGPDSPLWSHETHAHLPVVAANPNWRALILLLHQRIVAAHPGIITVGRDTAATLLPGSCHIVLTADLAIREQRRRDQFANYPGRVTRVGPETSLDQQTRTVVAASPHGIVLDTAQLTPAAVLATALHHLHVGRLTTSRRPTRMRRAAALGRNAKR